MNIKITIITISKTMLHKHIKNGKDGWLQKKYNWCSLTSFLTCLTNLDDFGNTVFDESLTFLHTSMMVKIGEGANTLSMGGVSTWRNGGTGTLEGGGIETLARVGIVTLEGGGSRILVDVFKN